MCVACGIGFNGFKDETNKKNPKWDYIITGNAWICETSMDP